MTISSTEAELLAISATGKELIWWRRFFESINFTLNQTCLIQCDNAQTIRALTENKFTTKLRHVDIHGHWLRQEIAAGKIIIQWISSTRIIADGLTKALPPQRHREFISLLGLVSTQGGVISKRPPIPTNEADFSMNGKRHDVLQEDVSNSTDDKSDEDGTEDAV